MRAFAAKFIASILLALVSIGAAIPARSVGATSQAWVVVSESDASTVNSPTSFFNEGWIPYAVEGVAEPTWVAEVNCGSCAPSTWYPYQGYNQVYIGDTLGSFSGTSTSTTTSQDNAAPATDEGYTTLDFDHVGYDTVVFDGIDDNGSTTLDGIPMDDGGCAYAPCPYSPGTGGVGVYVWEEPGISGTGSGTATVGDSADLPITATGYPFDNLAITSGGLPSGLTLDAVSDSGGQGSASTSTTWAIEGTPASGTAGTYSFTIGAENADTSSYSGSSGANTGYVGTEAYESYTLTVDQAPAITSGAGTTFTQGSPGNFTVTATGTPGAPTLVLSDGGAVLPSGVSFVNNGNATATLSGTPGAGTGGTYSVTITASNGVAPNATQSFTLTVDESPSITSADAATFTAGTSGSFTVTAEGFPGGPTLALSDGGAALPSGVTFVDNGTGSATLSGTPAAGTGGTYPVTITASNGVAPNATQNFTLTVYESPSITSPDSATFDVGAEGSFSVTASGFPASTFSETGSLTSGVSLSSSGILSGTPSDMTAGSYAITLTAANGISPSATQSFTLVVEGVLSLSVPSFASWSATLDGKDQWVETPLAFSVDDETGSGAGWTIEAATSGDFGSGGLPLMWNGSSASSLSAASPAASCDGDPACILPASAGPGYPVLFGAGSSELESAEPGTGEGPVEYSGNLWLGIPADTYSGTYSGTITVTLAAGPSRRKRLCGWLVVHYARGTDTTSRRRAS